MHSFRSMVVDDCEARARLITRSALSVSDAVRAAAGVVSHDPGLSRSSFTAFCDRIGVDSRMPVHVSWARRVADSAADRAAFESFASTQWGWTVKIRDLAAAMQPNPTDPKGRSDKFVVRASGTGPDLFPITYQYPCNHTDPTAACRYYIGTTHRRHPSSNPTSPAPAPSATALATAPVRFS
jgi:hypothetical protein